MKLFVERDRGMYDAVNRGLRRASGDILSYLIATNNTCRGRCQRSKRFSRTHPHIDVLFGDSIVVDSDLNYLFHRKVQVPLKHHTWVSHLPTLTCATFFRRSIIDEHRMFFDDRLRDVGDAEWMVRLLKRRIPMAVLRQFTSVFAMTGANMSAKPNAIRERRELQASAPLVVRSFKPLIVLHHRLRRLAGGIYSQRPFSRTASIHTRAFRHEWRSRSRTPRFRWKTH